MSDSCKYEGLGFSEGSIICANGRELRCSAGSWSETGYLCADSDVDFSIDDTEEAEEVLLSRLKEGNILDNREASINLRKSPVENGESCRYFHIERNPKFVLLENRCNQDVQFPIQWLYANGHTEVLTYRFNGSGISKKRKIAFRQRYKRLEPT